jgi:hypothetical protein
MTRAKAPDSVTSLRKALPTVARSSLEQRAASAMPPVAD